MAFEILDIVHLWWVWRDDWREAGLSTKPADPKKVEEVIHSFYKRSLHRPPPKVWLRPSPLACAHTILGERGFKATPRFDKQTGGVLDTLIGIFRETYVSPHGEDLARRQPTERRLEPAIASDCDPEHFVSLANTTKDRASDELQVQSLRLGVNLPLRDAATVIRCALSHALLDWFTAEGIGGEGAKSRQAIDQVLGELKRGQFDADWISRCIQLEDMIGDYFDESQEEWVLQWGDVVRMCGFWWPYEDLCIVCDRPRSIAWDEQCGLHNPTGPALEFRDGWRIWALNGVCVPEWLVTTPAEQLDPRQFFRLENAEVRREFTRKVGIDRICACPEVHPVDRWEGYELLLIDLDTESRPYLRMLNPSIGTWHVEGVHPECRTVAEALAWRDGEAKYQPPDVLT